MNWQERFKPSNISERIFLLITGFVALFSLTNYVGLWQAIAPLFSWLFWGYVLWKVSSGIYKRYDVSLIMALACSLSLWAIVFACFALASLVIIWVTDLLSWVLFILLIAGAFSVHSIYQRRKDDLFVGKLGFALRESV